MVLNPITAENAPLRLVTSLAALQLGPLPPLPSSVAIDDEQLGPLFLALPMPWRGMLTPYAGRLHGPSAAKKHLMIYDYVDSGVPV